MNSVYFSIIVKYESDDATIALTYSLLNVWWSFTFVIIDLLIVSSNNYVVS